MNKISQLNPEIDVSMLSFDVEFLFTNISTLETKDIILGKIYIKNKKYFHGLTKEELEKLLKVCTQESHFQFNEQYYDQIDGVSMGSPLETLIIWTTICKYFHGRFLEELHEKFERITSEFMVSLCG